MEGNSSPGGPENKVPEARNNLAQRASAGNSIKKSSSAGGAALSCFRLASWNYRPKNFSNFVISASAIS